MISLANTTKELRVGLKYAVIAIAILLLVMLVIRGAFFIKDILFPEKPPAPKQEFGLLPPSITNFTDSSDIEYRINTIDGTLPVFQDRINIYRIADNKPNFTLLDKAINNLDSAGFDTEPTKISDTVYQWVNKDSGSILQYDILNNNFKISSNFTSEVDNEKYSSLPGEEEIKKDLIGYLNKMGISTANISPASSNIELYELRDGNLIEAQNLGSAKYAEVNLYNTPIDEISLTYSEPNISNMNFVVAYSRNGINILDAEFYNHIINAGQKSDYGIKTAEQAFEDLQNGKAEIFNPNSLRVIDITDLELKYYLGRETKSFLQPIYVFTGIDFVGYVNAVPDISLKK